MTWCNFYPRRNRGSSINYKVSGMVLTHSDSKEHNFDDSKYWKFRLAGSYLLLKSRMLVSLKMKGTLNFPTISAFLAYILASSSVHLTCRFITSWRCAVYGYNRNSTNKRSQVKVLKAKYDFSCCSFKTVYLFPFCFQWLLADFQSTVVTTAIRRAGTETELNCNNFKFKHCKPG